MLLGALSARISEHDRTQDKWSLWRGVNHCHFRRISQMPEIMLEIPWKIKFLYAVYEIQDGIICAITLFCRNYPYFPFSLFFSSVWKLWGVSAGLMASSAPSSSAPDLDPNTANLRQPATSRSLWITRFSLDLFTPWGGDVHHCLKKHTAPCEMSITW